MSFTEFSNTTFTSNNYVNLEIVEILKWSYLNNNGNYYFTYALFNY